jgi:hypothetical protein
MEESNDKDAILIEFRKLHEKISFLESKIDKSSEILYDHINFIHKVFDIVKTPLFFIMNKVNIIFLSNDKNNEPDKDERLLQ